MTTRPANTFVIRSLFVWEQQNNRDQQLRMRPNVPGVIRWVKLVKQRMEKLLISTFLRNGHARKFAYDSKQYFAIVQKLTTVLFSKKNTSNILYKVKNNTSQKNLHLHKKLLT